MSNSIIYQINVYSKNIKEPVAKIECKENFFKIDTDKEILRSKLEKYIRNGLENGVPKRFSIKEGNTILECTKTIHYNEDVDFWPHLNDYLNMCLIEIDSDDYYSIIHTITNEIKEKQV